MMQEEAYKERLLPAITKLGFDEWEEIFRTRKDDILVHRVDINTMIPWIPKGSVALVDTTKKWPLSGELYLVDYCIAQPMLKRIVWTKAAGKPYVLELREEYIPYGGKKQRPDRHTVSLEELEIRKLDWIIGRVIGVVAMYHPL